MKTSRFLAVPLIVLGLWACGGSTSSVSLSLAQAANDAATAYCDRTQACAPAFIELVYGDVATCVADYGSILVTSLSAGGTLETPTQLEACAQALPGTSCADLGSRNPPSACAVVPGSLADGAACGSDSQCSGGRCHPAFASTVCGTCGEPTEAGGACAADDDCDYKMTCVSSACVAYGTQGSSCDPMHPCGALLGCIAGQCGAPSEAGTKCDTSAECDALNGLYCHPVNKQCVTISFAAPGAACGLLGSQVVTCSGPGGTCSGDQVAPYKGTCLAYAADGAGCNTDTGPQCNVGSTCVTATASATVGVCTLDDASLCQ